MTDEMQKCRCTQFGPCRCGAALTDSALTSDPTDEHATTKPVIDAMVERLNYLEVNAKPWGRETRSMLWQVFCAARAFLSRSETPVDGPTREEFDAAHGEVVAWAQDRVSRKHTAESLKENERNLVAANRKLRQLFDAAVLQRAPVPTENEMKKCFDFEGQRYHQFEQGQIVCECGDKQRPLPPPSKGDAGAPVPQNDAKQRERAWSLAVALREAVVEADMVLEDAAFALDQAVKLKAVTRVQQIVRELQRIALNAQSGAPVPQNDLNVDAVADLFDAATDRMHETEGRYGCKIGLTDSAGEAWECTCHLAEIRIALLKEVESLEPSGAAPLREEADTERLNWLDTKRFTGLGAELRHTLVEIHCLPQQHVRAAIDAARSEAGPNDR